MIESLNGMEIGLGLRNVFFFWFEINFHVVVKSAGDVLIRASFCNGIF